MWPVERVRMRSQQRELSAITMPEKPRSLASHEHICQDYAAIRARRGVRTRDCADIRAIPP